MSKRDDGLVEMPLDYETMVAYTSKLFKQNKEDKDIALIYEKEVPKISFDVEQAVRELRSSKTGGQIIT